ncbi:WhiB family transcriptional regulator [Nocardiopsis sp. HUAS JQ3]|uniref:WhiB family transcriptional regulator n=1 Tax=Nocardiopsis sp. HUAS JQ3 TaxID=3061629 RepID=UPI0023A99E9E|nr:WhiB family transcriptional regulator [Nocardiopsis sp. HUAS JQ3]WDZ91167.1 WhiB family transcriptional regulator [Nocardiopsis sp. HUAS JQ3]
MAKAARWAWARGVAADVVAGAARMPAPGWEEAAVCRSLPDDWSPDWWFPEVPHVPEEVRAACDRCPVRRECLIAAYLGAETYGVWGGLTPDQRSRALAPAKAARRVAA